MRTALILTFTLMIVLMAMSCGQKEVEESSQPTFPSFVYTSYDKLMNDAANANKTAVIGFYTDW